MHFPFIPLFIVPTILFSATNSDAENANSAKVSGEDIHFIETIWAPERIEDEGMDGPFLGGGTEKWKKAKLEKKHHHRIKRGGIGPGTLQMTKQFSPMSSSNLNRSGNFYQKGGAARRNLAMPGGQPVGIAPLKIRSDLQNNAPANGFGNLNLGNLKFGLNSGGGKNWNKIGNKNISNKKYNAGAGQGNGLGNGGGMDGVICHSTGTLANVAVNNGAELAEWSRRHFLNQIASIGLQINAGWKYPGDWANMVGEIMERYAEEELHDPNAIFIELPHNFSLANVQKIRSIAGVMEGVLECPVNVVRHRHGDGGGGSTAATVKRHLFRLNVVNDNGGGGATWRSTSSKTLTIDEKGDANLDDIELGQLLIRAICGGQQNCDPDMNAPEFGAKPWSIKPKPKSDELGRALRPMLLKLSAKLKRGHLWVDNPVKGYRNYYEVAVDMDKNMNEMQRAALGNNLGHIQRNSPFQFVTGHFLKPRHKLKFIVHADESKAPNGLQREEKEQIVYMLQPDLNLSRI